MKKIGMKKKKYLSCFRIGVSKFIFKKWSTSWLFKQNQIYKSISWGGGGFKKMGIKQSTHTTSAYYSIHK